MNLDSDLDADSWQLPHCSPEPNPLKPRIGVPTAACTSGTFLTFKLGRQEFAVNTVQVREVRAYSAERTAEQVRSSVWSVLRSDDDTISVMDLRQLRTPPHGRWGRYTPVIVTQAPHNIGLAVDSVQGVVELDPEQIRPPPSFGAADTGLVAGFGDVDGRTLVLLDTNALALLLDKLGIEVDSNDISIIGNHCRN